MKNKLKNKFVAGWLCLLLAFALLLIPTFLRDKDFSVNFIDVGQGDSILVSFDGHHALIDGGGSPYNVTDVGEYVVLPYLRSLGINHLDYCISTHPDADHIGGLLAVIDQMPVDTLVVFDNYGENQLYDKLLSLAEARGVNVDFAAKGDVFTLAEQVRLNILSPDVGEVFDEDSSNDGSLVTLVSYEDFDVLLTGDLQGENQRELLNWDIDFSEIEVLQMPHHGSKNSYDEDWYNMFSPEAVAISVGKDNSYGHPDAKIIDYWQNRGVTVLRTDEDGALLIKTDGKEGIYRTYRTDESRC